MGGWCHDLVLALGYGDANPNKIAACQWTVVVATVPGGAGQAPPYRGLIMKPRPVGLFYSSRHEAAALLGRSSSQQTCLLVKRVG